MQTTVFDKNYLATMRRLFDPQSSFGIGLLSLSVLAGCSESEPGPPPPPTMTAGDVVPETSKETTPDSSEVSTSASSERVEIDGLKFAIPANWEKVELSQMQMGMISARYKLSNAPDATLTLSRSGGGIAANIDRWRGQFEQSRPEVLETIRIADTDSSMIDLEGRFSGGFGQPPQDNWRMIGIIVPLSAQGYFIKLTGPTDQIKAIEEEFLAFAKSGAK